MVPRQRSDTYRNCARTYSYAFGAFPVYIAIKGKLVSAAMGKKSVISSLSSRTTSSSFPTSRAYFQTAATSSKIGLVGIVGQFLHPQNRCGEPNDGLERTRNASFSIVRARGRSHSPCRILRRLFSTALSWRTIRRSDPAAILAEAEA